MPNTLLGRHELRIHPDTEDKLVDLCDAWGTTIPVFLLHRNLDLPDTQWEDLEQAIKQLTDETEVYINMMDF